MPQAFVAGRMQDNGTIEEHSSRLLAFFKAFVAGRAQDNETIEEHRFRLLIFFTLHVGYSFKHFKIHGSPGESSPGIFFISTRPGIRGYFTGVPGFHRLFRILEMLGIG